MALHRPSRRRDLVIHSLGEDGRCVVKDPETGEYFHLGREEHFLLEQLDGERDAAEICAAFEERFGEPLASEELDEFLEMAEAQSLLENARTEARSSDDDSVQNGSRASGPAPHSSALMRANS